MPEPRATQIRRRFHELRDGRVHWDNHWQEVAEHSFGRRDFTVKREPGRQRNIRIYDTTALDANLMLMSALHAFLTNPMGTWFSMRFRDDRVNQEGVARRYLEAATKRLQFAFTRPRSGFAANIAQCWFDLPGFGNCCLYVEDDPGFGARFVARPLAEMYPEVDSTGRIVSIFRSFQLRAWQAVEEYGEKNLPAKIVKSAEEPAGGQDFDFLQHVRKRNLPMPGKVEAGGKAWESITIAEIDESIVRERGYRENPFLYARWDVDTGEVLGRGPGIWSLPNAKFLNMVAKTYIRGAEKAVDPAWLVNSDAVLPETQLKVTPNALVVVQDTASGRPAMESLQPPARFEPAQYIWERYEKRIENVFHSEIIKAFLDPRMTATQVLEIAKLSQRQLAPVLGRLQEELLDPLIARTWDIESRRSDFPPPPPELRGQEVKFEYVGPLARAQKAQEAQAILDTFAAGQALAQMDPSVIDNMDLDAAYRKIADSNAVPQEIIRLRSDVEAIREQRAREQAQEEFNQGLVQGSESLSKLLPAVAKFQERRGNEPVQ